MADVSGKFFSAVKVRTGVSPSSPGSIVGEPLEPVNPPGAGLSSVGITMPSAFAVANSPLTSNGTIQITGAGTISQYVRGDGTLETFPSLTGFVPYTGATQNVDLGEFGVDAGFVQLDTTPTNTPTTQGTIFWDVDDQTVDVVLNGYIMKIGEDQFYPVKNQTGSSIAKGTAVRFAGTVGASGRLLIAPFIADGTVSSSFFMGVTAEAIADGADGKVLYFGRIRGINTNAFNEGDVLYASTTVAGGFQTAVPVAPNNIVQVAAVITKSINQGVIFIRPSFGSNINQDEGVKIVSVANLDLLQYQSGTGLWENKTIDGAGIVTKATTQTISGVKTFSQDIDVNGVNVGRGGGNAIENTRLGNSALNANTTGDQNTAFGTQTLLNNTTGSFNTGLGYNALLRTTSGSGNTAIGTQSLNENTSGFSNTATGHISLYSNTTGSSNTANGRFALYSNTTGSQNTAVGNNSLQKNTIADNNTAVGYWALLENTTGQNNTALGESSLFANTTGSNNIGIGKDAGRTTPSGQNTTGSNSIFIGTDTRALANDQTNQIVIGHNAIGNGSNTVTIGNGSIANNYFTGNIRGGAFIKSGGTSAQFLKADGTLDSNTYQVTSEKAQPNGYASLDSNGKVPLVQINDALIGNVNFQGLWNASTNTPTLANPPASGTKGYYYIVSTAGTFASISFEVGDWIISDGTAWGKVDNTDAVSSVFGRTGNVTAANGDYTTAQVTESGNLYYTDGRARGALSFVAGSGAYNSTTGVITIPTNNNQITNGAGYITSAALSGYLPLTGGTLTGPLGGTSISLSGDITANRYRGVNSLVLNSYTTVNPSSNVYLYSPGNDRDAWIYLDSADTGSNWGIYHRQIDTVVSGLPGNSIGFIGGGTNTLQAWISLQSGDGFFAGNLTAINLSGTNTGNVTIGTANGLSLSGQELSLGLASGSANGALSSTDWTTFNNKQAAGNYVTTDTTQTITGQKTISRAAANFNGTVQSFLIDGASGGGSLTINSASALYSYQTFAQGGVPKFEIGIVGTSNNGSLYINRNIQTGETGASIYIKKADGFVGINNTDPSFQLDVNGTARVSGSSDLPASFISSGNETIVRIQNTGPSGRDYFLIAGGNGGTFNSGQFGIYDATDAVPRLAITSAGNVAIGTNNSDFRLQVFQPGDNWHFVLDGGTGQLRFGAEAGSGAVIQARTALGTTRPLYLQRDGGNLLIGTTTDAGFRLDVNGTGRFSGQLTITSTSSQPLVLNNQTNEQYLYINSASNREAMTQYYNATAGNWYTGIRTSPGLGSTSSYHIYSSSFGDDVFVLNTDGSARFQNRIGIGVSAATSLHVQAPTVSYGQVRITSTSSSVGEASINFGRTDQGIDSRWTVGQGVASIGDSFGFYTGGASRVNLRTNGNLGIGINSPDFRLQVFQPGDNWHVVFDGGTGQLRFGAEAGSGAVIQARTAGGTTRPLYLNRDGGSVLIGTTTSTGAKLEINGDIRTGALDGGYVSGYWKLGRALSGSQPSETHQIIVEINGALFSIGAASI
jgi:hypothetical protein